MGIELAVDELVRRGLSASQAESVAAKVAELPAATSPADAWQWITRHLLKRRHPFAAHQYIHAAVFADWDPAVGPAPAWIPDEIDSTNIGWLMKAAGTETYGDLYEWSIRQRAAFWETMCERLDVRLKHPYSSVLDTTDGCEQPRWLTGAKLNIVDSCFNAPDDSPAVVYQSEDGPVETMSVGQLRSLTWRVANGLKALGAKPGDVVAIDMPMTVESVAVFLGTIAAGCVVATVADSFAPDEIGVRLRITKPVCIFTQDYNLRLGKKLPLYEKVVAAGTPKAIVLSCQESLGCDLRAGDVAWEQFLSDDDSWSTASRTPSEHSTILFSSGTTGVPKAIPWDNTTPIKAAIDGHLHHDIRPGDVVCWPTNLGWMMGPWLVYASLMNRATIALHYGAPTTSRFGRFVQDVGVTMLGLVPSLVAAWKATGCIEGLDWSRIRAFSSTGECSNPTDMLFLMSLAGYKPIIEYCGGTEIGGGYITGTVVQPAAPATFSTPALGSEFVVLDEGGQPADVGELFLIPPSMGLSLELLNADHHQVYFADTPAGPAGQALRRHGDQFQCLPNGYFRGDGRVDDCMNLGGIKVSSLQIEQVVGHVADLKETAAIAVWPPGGGPNLLVIYAVPARAGQVQADELKARMQQEIRTQLNPLFKIHDVVVVDSLARTASNKVMRRVLRAEYEGRMSSAS